MNTITDAIGVIVGVLIVGMVLGLLLAFPTMWIWNSVFVSVLGVQSITWFQAWLIMVFVRLVVPTSSSK